ncbi:hypothetical protein [Burkholderia gladioli]|uniref:hypothetical protein n=1 Tax=Burkholderia gladioli TaxID=28095 RepID=UPI00164138EF|nr:hypothetical protein [Burkholderia gladioli]MDC6132053.1 hypothetical protein [Burkholderia gladioli]
MNLAVSLSASDARPASPAEDAQTQADMLGGKCGGPAGFEFPHQLLVQKEFSMKESISCPQCCPQYFFARGELPIRLRPDKSTSFDHANLAGDRRILTTIF